MIEANEVLKTDLVRRSIAGDAGAFEVIVRENLPAVAAVAYALTGDRDKSEDVSQETFLIAWQRLHQLQNPEKLRSWLCAIARNAARSFHRKQVHAELSEAESGDVEILPANYVNADEKAMATERQRIVWKAVEQIPEDLRVPLVMYYREGRSTRQVAEALEISEEAVRQRLSRARAMVKDKVSSLVENTLETGGPSPLLVGVIISSIGASATTVSAGPLVAGGFAKATGGTFIGLLGAFIGPIIGITGGFYGTNQRIKNAKSEEEKALLRRLNRNVLILIVIWATGVAATLGASYWRMLSIKTSVSIGTIWLIGYFMTLMVLINQTTSIIRAQRRAAGIRSTSAFDTRWAQTGNDFERQALESPQRWRNSVLIGFGGSILGLLATLLVLAAMAGDWSLYCVTMLFGIITVLCASWRSIKYPANYWFHFSTAMGGTMLYSMWAGWFFLSGELWVPTRGSRMGIFTVPESVFAGVVGFALIFAITGLFLHKRHKTS